MLGSVLNSLQSLSTSWTVCCCIFRAFPPINPISLQKKYLVQHNSWLSNSARLILTHVSANQVRMKNAVVPNTVVSKMYFPLDLSISRRLFTKRPLPPPSCFVPPTNRVFDFGNPNKENKDGRLLEGCYFRNCHYYFECLFFGIFGSLTEITKFPTTTHNEVNAR